MQANRLTLHPILTAETHNFPSGVAPFAGAETGTGGRLRDVQATGRGAHTLAGISAYCVGNLHIPGHPLPWEKEEAYPTNLALPVVIEVEASNGASDYGERFSTT
jgi:phosphoribosylformylglycinamidine synthase